MGFFPFINMVSIIIPTYNEKQNITLLIEKLVKLKFNKEIIIIDDNSPDKTAEEIKKKFKNNLQVRLFVRKNERGLGTAILYGINNSKSNIIISMDADFNHPPELIPELVKNIKNYDFIVASRFTKGGGMEDKFRYFFTYLFNLFLKYFLSFPTMDNMSGFYAVRRNKLLNLPLKIIYQGYGEYHLRLVWYTKKNGFRIKEIPVYYQKRKYGESKSTLFKMFFQYIFTAFGLFFGLE